MNLQDRYGNPLGSHAIYAAGHPEDISGQAVMLYSIERHQILGIKCWMRVSGTGIKSREILTPELASQMVPLREASLVLAVPYFPGDRNWLLEEARKRKLSQLIVKLLEKSAESPTQDSLGID